MLLLLLCVFSDHMSTCDLVSRNHQRTVSGIWHEGCCSCYGGSGSGVRVGGERRGEEMTEERRREGRGMRGGIRGAAISWHTVGDRRIFWNLEAVSNQACLISPIQLSCCSQASLNFLPLFQSSPILPPSLPPFLLSLTIFSHLDILINCISAVLDPFLFSRAW